MNPAPLTYLAPFDQDEAAPLNLRQRRPEVLGDLRLVASLPRVDDEAITIGAHVTQAQALADPFVRTGQPAVHNDLSWIGHPATRSVGTYCGCLALTDPVAELPALLTLLDGRVIVRGPAGRGDRQPGQLTR